MWHIEYEIVREWRAEAAREVGANRLTKTLRGGDPRLALRHRIGAWLPEKPPTKEVEPERV